MKSLMFCSAALLCLSLSQTGISQSTDIKIKDIPGDSSEGKAVIIKDVETIKKEAIEENKKEILSGSEDILGDENYTPSKVRDSWKKACADWKAEFRNQNKDSKILSLNCGKPVQNKSEDQTGQVYFSSKGTYKLR